MRFIPAVICAIAIALAANEVALAQASPRFEVASVKPVASGQAQGMEVQFLPGGRFVGRSIPPFYLIAIAYDLPFQSPRLTGGPDWIRGDRFDIEAAAQAGYVPANLSTKAREDRMKLMLRALLADRFKLRVRLEAKEQPVYSLTVAKGGPKLEPSKKLEQDCIAGGSGSSKATACHALTGGQGRGVHGDALSIGDVALYVQNWSDRPVVDNTGLTGLYNIQTEGWMPMRQRPPGPDGTPAPAEAGINDPDRQTLQTVFEQLGIRMQPARAVVDMLAIESIEHPSSD